MNVREDSSCKPAARRVECVYSIFTKQLQNDFVIKTVSIVRFELPRNPHGHERALKEEERRRFELQFDSSKW